MLAARETLRNAEQTVLLNAATAYMNLLRDTAILDLQRRNVEVLQEQLRQTRDRFNVGEVTRTDVAQAESRLAAGRSQVLTAEANYTTSRATYRQVIGVEPGNLAPAAPVDRFSPRNLPARSRLGTASTSDRHHRAIQRRRRAAGGQGRGRRALSDAVAARQVQQNWLATSSLAVMDSYQASVLGHAQRADLPGRRRIFR